MGRSLETRSVPSWILTISGVTPLKLLGRSPSLAGLRPLHPPRPGFLLFVFALLAVPAVPLVGMLGGSASPDVSLGVGVLIVSSYPC